MAVRVIRTPGPGHKAIAALVEGFANLEGKVGFFDWSKYPDGTPVAYVATIQEMGYPAGNIPARPFMGPTADEKGAPGGEWSNLVANGAKAIINGSATGSSVMEALGLQASGDIAKKISEITEPALKPGTIAARKRRYADKRTTGNLTKPLVDTRVMIQSVTYAVERGGAK